MVNGQDVLKMNLPKTDFRGLSPEFGLVYEILQDCCKLKVMSEGLLRFQTGILDDMAAFHQFALNF